MVNEIFLVISYYFKCIRDSHQFIRIKGHFYSEQLTYLSATKQLLLISQLTCLYFLKTLAGEAIERNYFDKNQQVVQEEEGEEEGSTEVKATKVAEVWPQRQPHTVC